MHCPSFEAWLRYRSVRIQICGARTIVKDEFFQRYIHVAGKSGKVVRAIRQLVNFD